MNKNSNRQVSLLSLFLLVLAFAAGFTLNAIVSHGDINTSDAFASGDEILIRSKTEKTIDSEVTVLSDGTVSLTLIGEVHVAGMSKRELTELLNEKYARYCGDPAISVFR